MAVSVRCQAAADLLALFTKGGTAKALLQGERPAAETAIVYGAVRRRGTLDAVLQAHSSRKLPLLKPETLAVLRSALFEILYLDDAPPHAVVHEACECVKELGRPEDAGFLNALLRAILRGSRKVPAAEATDPRRSLPRGDRSVRFRRAVFPDTNHDPEGHLAARGSTARWIAARRLREYGLERALRILDLQAETPSTKLRAVAGREETVRAALAAAAIPFDELPETQLFRIPPNVRASAILEACGGSVVFQDEVAARVVPFLDPSPGARALDWCAAPGGKTMHLAERVGPSGTVVACDIDAERLRTVAENAARLGFGNVECRALPCDLPDDFDFLLVDAPCSNTGVLARRPEARWRVREKDLFGMFERQSSILREALRRLRPGGIAVYSTCSLEPEENLNVVEAVARRGGIELLEARLFVPDEAGGDGGFMARLRRV